MKIIYLFIIICFFNIPAYAKVDDLIIQIDGEKYKTLKQEEIKDLKAINVDYYDYALRKSENFVGFSFSTLLTKYLATHLDKIVEVEFISNNGYKTYLPFESLKRVNSVLTYASTANDKFERYSQKEKAIVPLGPYYLVWDFKSIGEEDKYLYSSVYQISQINFITNKIDFGINDSNVDKSITLGFRTYKRYCLSCHAIEEWGGDLSLDLIKKKTLEKKGAEFIIKYALDPSKMNKNTKMLPLPKYKNNPAMARGIVDFLFFAGNTDLYIKNKKIGPESIRYENIKTIMNEMRTKKQN